MISTCTRPILIAILVLVTLAPTLGLDGILRPAPSQPGNVPPIAEAGPDQVTSPGRLLRFDPETQRKKEYPLPAGPGAGPYAVTVDGAGHVWVNEFAANTVLRFGPVSERFETFRLPTENTGIRKMVVDARGRLWYMGSHSGKLGVIE